MGVPSLIAYHGNRGDVHSPSVGGIGRNFTSLSDAYLKSAGPTFATEAQYKPQYVDLMNQLTQRQLSGSLDTYAGALPRISELQGQAAGLDTQNFMRLAPGALEALRQSNPAQAALIDQLNQSASAGLAAGAQLSPEDSYRIAQGVRGDWASRGLGASDSARIQEALALGVGGEQLRQQRQQFGTQTAGLNADLYTNPLMQWLGGNINSGNGAMNWLGTATGTAAGAGPTLFTSDQMGNLLNTIYGQKNANARATAQNNTELSKSVESGSGQWGSAIGGLFG
jgi:hypothetical protein